MPKRITLTEEERAQRRAADREYVKQAVEALRTSDGWQAWLSTRALFRTYSLGNQLLIAMQAPEAVRVASFRKWLSMGYVVNALAAWWLFGEVITLERAVGIGVILIGVYLVARSAS